MIKEIRKKIKHVSLILKQPHIIIGFIFLFTSLIIVMS